MKLLIDLDEEIYNRINLFCKKVVLEDSTLEKSVADAILNGVVLSEKDGKASLVEVLSAQDVDVLSLAFLYAKHIIEFGVDITEAWNSAACQCADLEKAYIRGRKDEAERQQNEFKQY